MSDNRRDRRHEGGFALILAILALMLLTFLGLTLATTTSTELRIATNYRWNTQALYNAGGGDRGREADAAGPELAAGAAGQAIAGLNSVHGPAP